MRRFEGSDGQRFVNAGHFEGGFVIVRFDLLPEHGRMLDRRVDHTGHGGVHAEDCLAGDDLGQVEK